MVNVQFSISVSCPWCGKGKTLADKSAKINVSCRCNYCSNNYYIDFSKLRASRAGPKARASPIKRTSHKN